MGVGFGVVLGWLVLTVPGQADEAAAVAAIKKLGGKVSKSPVSTEAKQMQSSETGQVDF